MSDVSTRLTPGSYLKHRRQAAQLSIVDVAHRIGTEPRTAEHSRGEWLELIEADAAPMTLTTIVALSHVFSFDVRVLWALEQIVQGGVVVPRLCRICACSEEDACLSGQGIACCWVEDDLCSACAPVAPGTPGTPA